MQVETFKSRNGTRVEVDVVPERDTVLLHTFEGGQYKGRTAIDVHTARRLGQFLAGLEDQ